MIDEQQGKLLGEDDLIYKSENGGINFCRVLEYIIVEKKTDDLFIISRFDDNSPCQYFRPSEQGKYYHMTRKQAQEVIDDFLKSELLAISKALKSHNIRFTVKELKDLFNIKESSVDHFVKNKKENWFINLFKKAKL